MDLKYLSDYKWSSLLLKEAGGGEEPWSCFVQVIRRHANPAALPGLALWRVPAWHRQCRAVNQSKKAAGRWLKVAKPLAASTPPLSLFKPLPLFAAFSQGPFLPPKSAEVFHRCLEKSLIWTPKHVNSFTCCIWGLKYSTPSFIRKSYICMEKYSYVLLLLHHCLLPQWYSNIMSLL